MHPGLQNILLTATAATTALSAGLLFAYSVSVNPGLGRLSDEGYLSAMQSINKAIQNPVFFFVFFSPLILLPASCWVIYHGKSSNGFVLLVIAAAIYIIGVIGVTVVGNVPLNNALDAFIIKQSPAAELHAQRNLFEGPWNRLHTIRTIASIASLVLILTALLKIPRIPFTGA